MLLGRNSLFLAGKLLERAYYTESGVPRFNDIVNVSHFGSLVRVAEEVIVLVLLLFCEFCLLLRILHGLEFLSVKNLDGTVRTHHCNVRRRPCVVDVSAYLLAAHHGYGLRRRIS